MSAWPSPLALAAGVLLALEQPTLRGLSSLRAAPGLGLVGLTVLAWGSATVFGRGAMRDLPLGVAAPLRLWAGLFTTALVIALRYAVVGDGIAGSALASAAVWRDLALLTTVSGALPLFVYFAGLRRTPAAIAGYCEMMYTVVATVIAWTLLPGGKLVLHQAIAAGVLLAAIVGLNATHVEDGVGGPA